MSNSGYGSSFSSLGRRLTESFNQLNKSLDRLSSGKRINKASDDAAGLAIADALHADAVVLNQGNRNIGDAQSALDIADGAISQISDISTRQAELATEAANGTVSDAQRQSLNDEYNALGQEAQRIQATTQFNGQNLLGSSLTVQVGSGGDANSQISSGAPDISGAINNLASQTLTSVDGARAALDAIKTSSASFSQARSDIGATSSRLQVASNNNSSQSLNATSAESQIRDADVAQEKAYEISARIKLQATTAFAAQAGQIDRGRILDLLK